MNSKTYWTLNGNGKRSPTGKPGKAKFQSFNHQREWTLFQGWAEQILSVVRRERNELWSLKFKIHSMNLNIRGITYTLTLLMFNRVKHSICISLNIRNQIGFLFLFFLIKKKLLPNYLGVINLRNSSTSPNL